jgi:hypothetical protein
MRVKKPMPASITNAAMSRAARNAVTCLPNRTFVARGCGLGGGTAALRSGVVRSRPPDDRLDTRAGGRIIPFG